MPQLVPQVLDATASAHPDRPAFRSKRAGAWHTTSWREYRDLVHRAARALLRLGVGRREGVVILGYNSLEWVVADVAAILAGAYPAGIYTTSSPPQCRYIAHHCDARVAFAEGKAEVDKLSAIKDELPKLGTIVQMVGEPTTEGVLSWEKFLALGEDSAQKELEARIATTKPDDVCTLIYTSGTTADPKSVMLSHENLTWVAAAIQNVHHFTEQDVSVSYLPLSHIAEQMLTIHGPMLSGGEIVFAESLEKAGDALREVHPTAFFGVPRVWEKIQAKIQAGLDGAPPLRKTIAGWARKKGVEAGYREQRGEPPPAFLGVADKLVHRRVRAALGLDRARLCATGAAPISRSTLDFFLGFGIPILEVYGMSECTAPATVSTRARYRTGSAGWVLPGSEVKIADDGEICIRGPHVFKGYLKDPAATAGAVDADGWLHSGDIGEIDKDGFLKITDRKKELIITAGGENISPQLVEGRLTSIPVVAQAVVIGDQRKYLAALLTLDPERLPVDAKAAGSPAREPAAAARCDLFRAYLEKQIEEVNRSLARVQTVKRFAILEAELSIAGGELTPTLKLKRRVIHTKYKAEIEKLYA